MVLQPYTHDHIGTVSIIRNSIEMDAITRLQDDAILRDALDEALDLFGDQTKKILLFRLGIVDKDGNRIPGVDIEGNSLDYKRLTDKIVQIFGDCASRPVLLYLDKKIEERRSQMAKSN